MFFDSHTHLNFTAFDADRDQVIQKTLADNVWMINVGSNYETSKKAVEIAEQYDAGAWATIGLHPIHVATGVEKKKMDPDEGGFVPEGESFNAEKYRALAASKKVVAIGEIGLDYYYKPKSKARQAVYKEKQKEAFIAQLKLAQELGLPVALHCRMAYDDMLEILKEHPGLTGVAHCFAGDVATAQRFLDLGFHIGFTGLIFKLDLDEVIKAVPLERVLIETDCPYLTPPAAGVGRNEPRFVKYIAERIAEVREVDVEKIAQATTQNAQTLFKLHCEGRDSS